MGGLMPDLFQVSTKWRTDYADAYAGVLILRGVANPPHHAELEKLKDELESRLRERYAGFDRPAFLNLPALRAYDTYYSRFKKTYHVQLQLESIVRKGKSIPGVSSLVEAMFMAEMEDLLLTAGHDLDTLQLPLKLDAAKGDEEYTLMRGENQILKPDDMFIRDREGVISSVIYGPDRRTQIRPETKNAIFTVYAPIGISMETVKTHLQHIEQYVRCFAPEAATEMLEVFHGGEKNSSEGPTEIISLSVVDQEKAE
jgi:DNA/RNA-binding domain of Phe-tRNA-synthetase-like protein